METFVGSCRLCLWKGDKMISLFLGRDKIISKIRLCLPIQVDMEDNLPKEICYQCNYKLEVFSEFYQTCIRSDKILKQYNSQIRKNVVPEIKIEVNDEINEDSVFTSNDSLLKSKVDTVAHSIDSLNSKKGGFGLSQNGTNTSENTVLCKTYNNEVLTKSNCEMKKVNGHHIRPSNSYCSHKGQTSYCCYKCNNRGNKTSVVSNSPSKTVSAKDSSINVLLNKTDRSDCVVESVSKSSHTLFPSSSSRSKTLDSFDHTDTDSCELENGGKILPNKSPEKFPISGDNQNSLQTVVNARSCEVTYSNIKNCYQEPSISEVNCQKRKSTYTKFKIVSVTTLSDQDNKKTTDFEETSCTLVSKDCPVSKELNTDNEIYSDKRKKSKATLHVKKYRKYFSNVKNQKNSARSRGRIKLKPKKGRQCEKMKIKNRNQNVGSVVVQKNYSCLYCKRKYSSRNWCLRHEKTHIKNRQYNCADCDSNFLTLLQLSKHECKNRNQNVGSIVVQKNYSCLYCKRKYSRRNWCLRHEKTHIKNRQYNCADCDSNFVTLSQLSKHECIELFRRHIENDHSYCSFKSNDNELRNSSNFKKNNTFKIPQQKIKKFVSINMKKQCAEYYSVN